MTWLVVGLGNPGLTHAGNRHNAGAMAIQELAKRHDQTLRLLNRSHAKVSEVRLSTLPGGAPGTRSVLAVPTSFMNESGDAVAALLRFFDVDLDRLVVLHDDLDIPPGVVRLKRGGGEGGHNGLRSVSGSMGSRDYLRVRVGIGRPPGRMDPATFVLRDFSVAERKVLPFSLAEAADAVESLVDVGLVASQQRFHTPTS